MGFARRLTAIVANLSLLLNSFLPFILAIQPVYAQSPEGDVPAIVEVVDPEENARRKKKIKKNRKAQKFHGKQY